MPIEKPRPLTSEERRHMANVERELKKQTKAAIAAQRAAEEQARTLRAQYHQIVGEHNARSRREMLDRANQAAAAAAAEDAPAAPKKPKWRRPYVQWAIDQLNSGRKWDTAFAREYKAKCAEYGVYLHPQQEQDHKQNRIREWKEEQKGL